MTYEQQLRECPADRYSFLELEIGPFSVLTWARDSLGIGKLMDNPQYIPDALSEAIEAAEALGL